LKRTVKREFNSTGNRLEANGEDRKVRASDSTRRPFGGVAVDMSRGSLGCVAPVGGGRTFGARSATTGSPASREERRVGGSEDRQRDSLRATGDMLAKRKLARFAERTNEGQAGLLAGSEGGREAEIDLVPKPDLRIGLWRVGARQGKRGI